MNVADKFWSAAAIGGISLEVLGTSGVSTPGVLFALAALAIAVLAIYKIASK